ncbi:APC family permease [Oscillibacter sp. MSJ-2]|uniref:APC family permease n=1 Tax=Dysosmobacter acutus TaxID=2841504 RepID=A0ABS6FFM0_9FIRM|nr:APC family permease [Dysosmobacter acutus]MBU5628119.1 APC family permease [Dysosmobacter acutus]
MGNKLKKELSLSQIIAMAAGGMIAAWMVEIKYWFEMTGPGSLICLFACGVILLPLCLIYTEMTGMLPYAGGENIWTTNAFNWDLGWVVGWFLFLLYLSAMPNVTIGISTMVGYLVPLNFAQLKILACVIITVWFIMVNLEIKHLAKIQNFMFWSTLVVSVGASLIFIFSDQWKFSNLSPWFPKGAAGFSAGLGLLMFKFIGFDLIPQLVEESKFPRKKIIWGFIGSMLCTFLVYGLAVIAVGGIVSNEWIAQTDIVDPRVADILGMHWLALVIIIMGAVTCITTLSGFWLAASRTIFGAAQQGQVSRKLAVLNKHGQPWLANTVVFICSLYFCLMAPDAWINYIFTITVGAAGVVYLCVSLSFLKLRKTHPEWPRPYKCKAAWFMGIESIVFCIYCLYQCVIAMDAATWVALGVYFAVGAVLYVYAKVQQKRDPANWTTFIPSPDTVKEEAE